MIKETAGVKELHFSAKTVDCYFNTPLDNLPELAPVAYSIIITDANVYDVYQHKLAPWRTIVLPAGEQNKTQKTVDDAILKLLEMGADRNTFIIGIGGGVVTDLTGYIASIFMRGVKFAFVPTTILAMVDACVGGKNGVDVGPYKNLVGTINQPQFLLYDFNFLHSLPQEQWRSGFAEIIKHACIYDEQMFRSLQSKTLEYFMQNVGLTGELVEKNVNIKYSIVKGDENETGARKLLNFGHTIGHAIENVTGLLHGYAISVGMADACKISQTLNGFTATQKDEVIALLLQYGLPVQYEYSKEQAWQNLLHDKKKSGETMNFVVLDKIGTGSIKPIPINELKELYGQL